MLLAFLLFYKRIAEAVGIFSLPEKQRTSKHNQLGFAEGEPISLWNLSFRETDVQVIALQVCSLLLWTLHCFGVI